MSKSEADRLAREMMEQEGPITDEQVEAFRRALPESEKRPLSRAEVDELVDAARRKGKNQ